jgi:hypothetical protein
MENIFHSGLDGTMILYTMAACFAQTEIRWTMHIFATSDFCKDETLNKPDGMIFQLFYFIYG